MKIILSLLLFVGISMTVMAQSALIPTIKVTQNNSFILDKNQLSDWELELAKLLNPSQLNYSLGIDYTYKLNDKLKLRSGLAFQDLVFFSSKIEVEPTDVFEFNAYKRVSHTQYLQLPIGIQYSLKKQENWNIFIDLGGNLNYFIRDHRRITIYDSNDKKIETKRNTFENTNHRTINYGLLMGFGVNYNISDKLFCRFIASGDAFFLSSLVEDDEDDYYYPAIYYNYGLSIGLGYNL